MRLEINCTVPVAIAARGGLVFCVLCLFLRRKRTTVERRVAYPSGKSTWRITVDRSSHLQVERPSYMLVRTHMRYAHEGPQMGVRPLRAARSRSCWRLCSGLRRFWRCVPCLNSPRAPSRRVSLLETPSPSHVARYCVFSS